MPLRVITSLAVSKSVIITLPSADEITDPPELKLTSYK